MDRTKQARLHYSNDYQPFQGLNEALQSCENRAAEPWPSNLPISINSPGFLCPTCQKSVKTKSELKKHDLRHKKPFGKAWPRLDNFRSHLRRVHESYIQSDAEFSETIRLGEFYEQSGLNQGASLSADVPTQRTSQKMEANESPPKPQEIKTNWKPVYPDLIQDLVTPMDTPMDKPFVDSNVSSKYYTWTK
ncbi:hypothetical protein DID88_003337 [Monilinia fructigena]|uniref:C2H2-type domain-containing protein n=1 Tax=Monilinia fructigena TaxID=38457 RepID=A0A395IEH3_9HELO|nr:hypothetical protein DID88_003337 [Monilinia fructigena]